MEIMDFYEAFNFLYRHPVFKGYFLEQLDIEVVKVNPETNMEDLPLSKNTLTQVWLECGHLSDPDSDPDIKYHDLELDCGGNTFEEAIIELARNVFEKFGSYEVGVSVCKTACLILDIEKYI